MPALYGTFGAAAGSARLLGLTPLFTNYALGLAAAFTGGTFQGHEEGAWQRSLNGGMASERGVTAAELAETGFRATELGLEGIQAFAKMYSDGRLDVGALFDGLGESLRDHRPLGQGVSDEPDPACAGRSAAGDHAENDLRHTDIEQIDAAWQKVEPFLAKHKVSTVVPLRPASRSHWRWPRSAAKSLSTSSPRRRSLIRCPGDDSEDDRAPGQGFSMVG